MFDLGMNPPIRMTYAEWFTNDGISVERIDPIKDKYQKFRNIKIGDKIQWTVNNKFKTFVFDKKSKPESRMIVFHFKEV